jgi:hypothetical protein
MKILYALCGLQLAGIAYLAAKPDHNHEDAATAKTPIAAETDSSEAFAGAILPVANNDVQTFETAALSEDNIRRIIREELAAVQETRPAEEPPRMPPHLAEQQRRAVDRQVDFLIAKGVANETDFAQLQMAAAKLPPDERQAVMNRLTRAMSAGDIDGRF